MSAEKAKTHRVQLDLDDESFKALKDAKREGFHSSYGSAVAEMIRIQRAAKRQRMLDPGAEVTVKVDGEQVGNPVEFLAS